MGRGRRVAALGAAVALSYVLGFVSIPVGFAGGQVALDMVPLVVLARLFGTGAGVLAGAVYGLLHLVQEPFLMHPAQVVLDYPLAFGLVGLAGLPPAGRPGDAAGAVLGGVARYAAHVLSGVVFLDLFMPQGVPGSPLAWSMAYNASYMVPSTLVAALVAPPLVKALQR